MNRKSELIESIKTKLSETAYLKKGPPYSHQQFVSGGFTYLGGGAQGHADQAYTKHTYLSPDKSKFVHHIIDTDGSHHLRVENLPVHPDIKKLLGGRG